MCMSQAFYSKFYVPEKDNFPSEVETTDKLARAIVVSSNYVINALLLCGLYFVYREGYNKIRICYRVQGFCETVIPLTANPNHMKIIVAVITAIIPPSTVPNTVRRVYYFLLHEYLFKDIKSCLCCVCCLSLHHHMPYVSRSWKDLLSSCECLTSCVRVGTCSLR